MAAATHCCRSWLATKIIAARTSSSSPEPNPDMSPVPGMQWNTSTEFGAFLDPVADKLMVSTALVLLARYSYFSQTPNIMCLP